MVDLSYYVIQPLITNIKTGNVWHDCLLITIALFSLTFVNKICNYGIEKLQSLITSITWRRLKARYSINIIANPNSSLDTRMQVIIRRIYSREQFCRKRIKLLSSLWNNHLKVN